MIRTCLKLLLLVLLFTYPTTQLLAKEKSVSLGATVDAGEIHTTKLGNLPRAASVSISLTVNGKVRVLLLSQSDFVRFPDIRAPLFSGTTGDSLDFSVKIPATGHYYLLVDNRGRKQSRNLTLAITASNNSGDPPSAATRQMENELAKFETSLKKYFIFNSLNFKVGHCGTANAFSRGDTVILCAEIAPKLLRIIGDETKAQDALMFAIMHEIGHVLLKQWGYPFYDNEELADEFATALLVMFNQGQRARSQAEYFARLSTEPELEKKKNSNDKHPLSVQRARNILGWLQEPDLVRRWQKVLVPQMQTRVLRALVRQPKDWSDTGLMKAELAKR